MQKRFFIALKLMLVVFAAGALLSSCKRDFDQPPSFIEPNVKANTTIKQLKAMHIIGAIEKINQDLIIGGVVVADDKSGNFYKSIAIQDETGGITVRLDGTNLFTSYPVGRKIYIKLNGLYLGDYNRLIQIGGGIDNTDPSRPELSPLASTLFNTYILKGSLNNTVTPKVVTTSELHDSLQSMLIQINNTEFVVSDTSKTYADAVGQQSVNLNVKSCSGSSVILRTSGFANFAGVNVPNGNGTLLAVYTMFGSTKQLLIRDTSDVRFTGVRCGSGPTTLMNISDVRALYTGTTTSIPDGKKITGVVISDRTTANLNGQNLILQQGNGLAGIYIRFDAPHTFNLGDSLDINVSGQEISEFNKTLQINGVPLGYATRISTGKTITPRVATLAQIGTNFDAWESTLVTVNNVGLTGSGTYSGNVTLNDGSGTIILFTTATATFAGQSYPANASSVTGYLTEFNTTKEISIRNSTDVVAGASTATVTTNAISAITQTTATSGGNVTAGGTSSVTARGVVWSTSTAPTVALSTKTTDGSGTGTFTSSLTGLTAGTTYYVRAYATNASGTSYGNEVSFTTTSSAGGSSVTEDFETGAKTGYTTATVALNSGSWTFSDALLGTAAGSDIFNGIQSARIRGTVGSNNGYIQTEFGYNGLQSVVVKHAQTNFNEGTGTITPSFELYISKNGGTTWTKVGATTATTKGTFTTTTFTVSALPSENV
ncbi:MAG: hypothetical protein EON98_08535, partial [Chitinophagaceae bacterium]